MHFAIVSKRPTNLVLGWHANVKVEFSWSPFTHYSNFLIVVKVMGKWFYVSRAIYHLRIDVHMVDLHKVRAHTGIIGNEIADTLANEGALKENPLPHPTYT